MQTENGTGLLAISYSKLGSTQSVLGNLEQAAAAKTIGFTQRHNAHNENSKVLKSNPSCRCAVV